MVHHHNFKALKRYAKKVRKFATKIVSRQNSVNQYFGMQIHIFIFQLLQQGWCFVWRTWCFVWRTWCFVWRTWCFVWRSLCLVVCLTYIIYLDGASNFITKKCSDLWIYSLHKLSSKQSIFRSLWKKGTLAWKRYTTVACGGCDNYQVCIIHDSHLPLIIYIIQYTNW